MVLVLRRSTKGIIVVIVTVGWSFRGWMVNKEQGKGISVELSRREAFRRGIPGDRELGKGRFRTLFIQRKLY